MQIETPATSAGPFAHAPTSIQRTMVLVMLALLPATVFGFWQFGWPAIFLFLTTLGTAVAAEWVCLRIAGKPQRRYLLDGSAVVAGWLLALSLPPWAPWWIGAIGALIAIVVAKQVFGGLGQNIFNPAMVARVALLISFPLEMTSYVRPLPIFSPEAPGFWQGISISLGQGGFDAVTGATLLSHVRTELSQGGTLSDILPGMAHLFSGAIGTIAGSMGETSALLILLGGGFLLLKRVISWHIPVALVGSLALIATLMNLYDADRYAGAPYHLVSGATLLVAFFIATDPVTSPVSKSGQILFGAGCGILVYVIRTWAGYPEGVGFAILLMNACTPTIDHYLRPRVYGRDRRGTPIEYADNAEMRK
ncbi:MAG: RnfABCDGE type electron transport complex subunit D [Thiocapsa sp.]|jgi:electron transport complex protein RnfD|nr:RnfABCDGE type electron transport complex subunit D [Thiocapsa sp.]MCG6896652.1 RnfABCDGE type electron transport complex subunit D [Thiocapsa sp.]MCG6984701.1 RnfABCDGE type electron transport complex subunit D [Thiocapsa sp.]